MRALSPPDDFGVKLRQIEHVIDQSEKGVAACAHDCDLLLLARCQFRGLEYLDHAKYKSLEAPIRQIVSNAGGEGSIVVGKLLEQRDLPNPPFPASRATARKRRLHR